jgi:glycosyltransferase involved in cell wall biosynthesis
MIDKPRLLIVSRVYPFPGSSGQQQRVFYKIKAFREHFYVTFLSVAEETNVSRIESKLHEYCDDVILLPSLYDKNILSKIIYRLKGKAFVLRTGLKLSNFLTGRLEFSPKRIQDAVSGKTFDVVLYEYWHAAESTRVFKDLGIPVILDMHNLLWKSYEKQLDSKRFPGNALKRRAVDKYRKQEEDAWKKFDGLIAINRAEYEYVKERVPRTVHVFYTPMGIDLSKWPYCWQPSNPPRIAYYGGLGSAHNCDDALQCYEKIMPSIWEKKPDVEFWIIGSNPPDAIQRIPHKDRRVHVTGYVEKIQEVLKSMSVVLCPWEGEYGFRSRVVEVMATGVPLVTSSKAVHGMDIDEGTGVGLADSVGEMALKCCELLESRDLMNEKSLSARRHIEDTFSFEQTYAELSIKFKEFIQNRRRAY